MTGLVSNAANVAYKTKRPMSAWRRISMGSWRPTGDSSVFVELDLPVHHILDSIHQHGGQTLPVNAVFSKMIAKAISTNELTRRINSVVRSGAIYERQDIDLFFHAVITPDDLSGFKLKNPHESDLSKLAIEIDERVHAVRNGHDRTFHQVKGLFRLCHGWLSKLALDLTGFFSYTLNLNLSVLGVPRDAFGSIMVTNVGSLGIDGGFTIIAPYSRIPCVIAICSLQKKPLVETDASGQDILAIRPVVRLGMTFDHRIVDGIHIAAFVKEMKRLSKEPQTWL